MLYGMGMWLRECPISAPKNDPLLSWREDQRIPDQLSPVAEKSMGDCSSTWQNSEKSSPEHKPEKCCHKPGGRMGRGHKRKWLPRRTVLRTWHCSVAALLSNPCPKALHTVPLPTPSPTWASFCTGDLDSVCLSLSLSLSLYPLQTDSTPCLKRVVIWRFTFLFFFFLKLMFSCQPGRQTACINLSHAKDPFKAAIICSGFLILWGQWEGPWSGAAFIHVKLQSEDLSCHSKYWAPSMGKHFQLKYPGPPNPQISYA
jgi:hypothetical protein